MQTHSLMHIVFFADKIYQEFRTGVLSFSRKIGKIAHKTHRPQIFIATVVI